MFQVAEGFCLDNVSDDGVVFTFLDKQSLFFDDTVTTDEKAVSVMQSYMPAIEFSVRDTTN